MSTSNAYSGADKADSSCIGNPSDLLDFLNSSDNENEEPQLSNGTAAEKVSEDGSVNEDSPSLTLSITNVVVMASMQCHLRLKEIARTSVDVEYKALQNHVIMRLRSPYTVATIWSSGKIWCTGSNSLVKAKIGARRIARRIAKCGFPCHFSKYRVVNIMATCHLPFRVRLEELVNERPMQMSYEPELAPGLTFKSDPNSSTSLKLFSTGRIVIMGSGLEAIGALVEELVPLAALHQTDEPVSDSEDENEQSQADARAAAAAARQMAILPDGLSLDALGYDDEIDDVYGDKSDDSDFEGFEKQNGYSTDDSTDSGASIDSGGVSTKHKNRMKNKPRNQSSQIVGSNHTASSLKLASNPIHLMTTREAADLAFSRKAAGDIEGAKGLVAAAADLRRQYEMGIDQTDPPTNDAVAPQTQALTSAAYTDPTWSRKAVASGSTKRACVVTYSGTEDSSDSNKQEDLPAQLTQDNLGQIVHLVHPTTATSTNVPRVVTAGIPPQQQQFVVVTTAQQQEQEISQHQAPLNAIQPHSEIHIASPHMTTTGGQPAAHVIRLAPTSGIAAHTQNGCSVPSSIYPIGLTGGIQTTVIPSMGPKFVTLNPIPSAGGVNQFVNFAPVTAPQTYQIYRPPVVASPVVVGSAVFPSSHPVTSHSTGHTLTSNPNNVLMGTLPTSVHINTQAPQSISTVTVNAPFVHTFVQQPQAKLP
ncbi:unnamed protein product [Calicophoron daubneyi]|uniref:Uncharacterized protein n=1 Tax=Calicophoron daubneyi TaxID=300641 RepID=A0AAV2TC78_CALDB